MAVWIGMGTLAVLLLLAVHHDAHGISTYIKTAADGTVDCDGMTCPKESRCLVSSQTRSGISTVNRKCMGPDGYVVLESTYNSGRRSLLNGSHRSSAVLY